MNTEQPLSSCPVSTESSGPPGQTANNRVSAFDLCTRLPKKRLALAFAIAAISDVIGAFVTLAVPVAWALDLATAFLLFAVLGWQWLLLPGLRPADSPRLSDK
jgi:hypothetical protein